MSKETELERMVVRLLGDGSQYFAVLNQAKTATTSFATSALGSLRSVEMGLKNLGGSIKNVGSMMSSLGTKFSIGVTAPLTALAGAAIRETTMYEAALSRMEGLVGLTKNEIAGFSDEIKKLAVETGKAPLELAKAMENITSSGVKGDAALETLQITAKAAAGGLGEVRAVSDTVTSAMNAYGVANLSATKATDILVAAVREGKAEAESFAPVLGNVLPIANEMGISFEEAAGSIAYLTLATGSASTAATQYQNILAQTIKLNEKHDAGKLLEGAGISIKQFQKDVADKGLLDSLMKMKETLAGKGLSLKNAFPDVQAMTAALQLTGANAAKAKQVIDSVGKAGGSVDQAFGAASQTKAFKFAQQQAQLKIVLLEIGDILQEVVSKLVGYAQSGIDLWKKLSEESKKYVVQLAAIAAAIGPVLVVSGLLVTTVGALIGGLGTIIGLLVTLGTSLASTTGLVLTLGAVILTQTNDGKAAVKSFVSTVRSEFMAGFDSIKNHVQIAMKGISDAIQAGDIKLAFEIATNEAKLVWVEFTDYMASVFHSAMEPIRMAIAGWQNKLDEVSLRAKTIAGSALSGVTLGLVGGPKLADVNQEEGKIALQGMQRILDATAPAKKQTEKIEELQRSRKALLEKAEVANNVEKLFSEHGSGASTKKVGGGEIAPRIETPKEISDLMKSEEVDKKIHVKIDFKTVGAGTGEHLDLLAEYMSGRPVNLDMVRQKEKPRKSPKFSGQTFADISIEDEATTTKKAEQHLKTLITQVDPTGTKTMDEINKGIQMLVQLERDKEKGGTQILITEAGLSR